MSRTLLPNEFFSLTITPGNGVCPAAIDSSPSASSPPRQQHAKHGHSNGRARLNSRSGSMSYAGSPRPSLTRQPSAATDAGLDGSKPNDYLIWAILACLCPVWPINIVGLTFSVMVCVCGQSVGSLDMVSVVLLVMFVNK